MSTTYTARLILGVQVDLSDIGVVEKLSDWDMRWTARYSLGRMFELGSEFVGDDEEELHADVVQNAELARIPLKVGSINYDIQFFGDNKPRQMAIGVVLQERENDEGGGYGAPILWETVRAIDEALVAWLKNHGITKVVGIFTYLEWR